MAVSINARATADAASNNVATVDLTTLTIAAGANIALMAVLIIADADPLSPALNWDQTGTPQAMTEINSASVGTGFNGQRIHLFGRIAPTIGNKTLRATISAAQDIILWAFALNGVNQTGG